MKITVIISDELVNRMGSEKAPDQKEVVDILCDEFRTHLRRKLVFHNIGDSTIDWGDLYKL